MEMIRKAKPQGKWMSLTRELRCSLSLIMIQIHYSMQLIVTLVGLQCMLSTIGNS